MKPTTTCLTVHYRNKITERPEFNTVYEQLHYERRKSTAKKCNAVAKQYGIDKWWNVTGSDIMSIEVHGGCASSIAPSIAAIVQKSNLHHDAARHIRDAIVTTVEMETRLYRLKLDKIEQERLERKEREGCTKEKDV